MSRPRPFTMHISDIFRFQDGRTVFAGTTEGTSHYIPREPTEIWVDDEKKSAPFLIEGEMLFGRADPGRDRLLRSVATFETRCLDRESLANGRWELRSARIGSKPDDPRKNRRIAMHRHLLGLDSPPPEYIPDPMTLGPVLPEGWDGDAWVDPNEKGYFLRAWSKQSARVAYGRGSTYDEARRGLLEGVTRGIQGVKITLQEIGRD